MCLFWNKNRNKEKDQGQETGSELELVKLVTVRNSYELGIAESILSENDVPYVIRQEAGSGFLKIVTGALLVQSDIMVEKSYFEKAKDLVYMLYDEEVSEN